MPSISLLSALFASLLALSASPAFASTSTSASARHRRHARRGLPSGWQALGCRTDSTARALAAHHFNADNLTPQSCIAGCAAQGFAYAGVEFSQECFCANKIAESSTAVDSSQCNAPCIGDASVKCGGNWHVSIFSNTAAGATHVSTTSTSPAPTKSTEAAAPAGTGSTVTPVAITNIPASSSDKLVVSHFIVGNSYSFTPETWKSQIALAQGAGIDAFALNFGSDVWQPDRIADAYTAAAAAPAPGFKMFLSFDATANACASAADAERLRGLIARFAGNGAQLHVKGNPLLSTFGGEGCRWGQGDVNAGWKSMLENGPKVHFVPSFFVGDPVNLKNFPVTDGDFSWDGSWPREPEKVTFDIDSTHLAGNQGKTFMAAASPWFYTHYSFKNFLWYTNEFLYSSRWEQLIANRDKVDIVQVISWNDYGESHYIGPIGPDQPNSQAWVDGFDHTAWLDMTALYARAFKTGAPLDITQDRLVAFSRPHPAGAGAPDPLQRPTGADWFAKDVLMVVAFLTEPGTLTLRSGGNTQTFEVQAGVSKVSVPNAPGTIRATLGRAGQTVVDVAPSREAFEYTLAPKSYNYNAFVASAKSA